MSVVCLIREAVAPQAVARLGVAGPLQVCVDDADVAGALLRISTLDPPVRTVVTLPDSRGLDLLRGLAPGLAAYDVEDTVVLAPPDLVGRTPGLLNVALLRIPEGMSPSTWQERWQRDHTPVAIATQATSAYVQRRVLCALTPDAPRIHAVVEELFPIEALGDLHAFYGSGGDDAELGRRMEAMLDSVARFGADRDVDVVPTSRYLLP